MSEEFHDMYFQDYWEDRYKLLENDIGKNRELLLFLLPHIWFWEDNNRDEFKKIIKDNYKFDISFFKDALKNYDEDGSCLLLAGKRVIENREVLLLAVSAAKNHNLQGNTIDIWAPNSLKTDQKFLSEVLKIYPREFEGIGNYVTEKNTVIDVLKVDGSLLQFALDEFKKDHEIIKVAIQNDLNAIQFVPRELKSNLNSPFFDEWYKFKDGNITF